jgi:hypothetical protein
MNWLNMLEKLSYITDAQRWFVYRKARNAVAHEYRDNLELMLKNFEEIFMLVKELLSYWQSLEKKIQELKH